MMNIDEAVRAISVFRSWASMRDDIVRTGYIPTIRDDDAVAPTEELKNAALMVRAACDEAGLTWYDGAELHRGRTSRNHKRRPGKKQ